MEVTLNARSRPDTRKGSARQSRREGLVPAVVYGKDLQPQSVAIERKELLAALHTEAGLNVLVNIQLDSKKYFTVPREIQRNPVTRELLHIDFVKVARNEIIRTGVPVHIVGESHGVKEGGVLEHHLWEIEVEALPADVPPTLEVDVSSLGIGEHLRVEHISAPQSVHILTHAEEIVVSIVTPAALLLPEAQVSESEEEAAKADQEDADGKSRESSGDKSGQ